LIVAFSTPPEGFEMRRVGVALAIVAAAGVAVAQTTTRVTAGAGGAPPNGNSYSPAISADGRFVAYHSIASNLVAGDQNGVHDVFVTDRFTGRTERASVGSAGEEANGDSSHAAISADGRFVAFQSIADDLAPGDGNGDYDVFVHDRLTGRTEIVSVDSAGAVGAGRSWYPSISADGRFVAFSSTSASLVPGDTNGVEDVFVRDRAAGVTIRASVSRSGDQAVAASFLPAISADGRRVAFTSAAWNLSPYSYAGTFVRYLDQSITRQVREDTTGGAIQGTFPAISADGRWVAIESRDGLVRPDTNGRIDVFVRDMDTPQTTTIASVRADGGRITGHESIRPAISGDGRYVLFVTDAPDVVAGDANGASDVFRYDMRDRSVVCVSVTPAGVPGNACSGVCADFGASMSADGCAIAFFGFASDLVPGDDDVVSDVFVRDYPGAAPFAVTRVVPATGSAAGGDVVNVIGCGFTSASDTSVRFGAASATVLDVRPERIAVRTPAGSGAADVVVTSSLGTAGLAGAFAFLDPVLAARLGNVNVGAGDREDVLLVNDGRGDAARVVFVPVGSALRVSLAAPSSRVAARFVLWGWPGAPSAATLEVLPRGLGALACPPPFAQRAPQPALVVNLLGHRRALGAPNVSSAPAPTIVIQRSAGRARPVTATLQGLVEDDASGWRGGLSVTNAVILRVE
jgi:Tol biopolymer transport system component